MVWVSPAKNLSESGLPHWTWSVCHKSVPAGTWTKDCTIGPSQAVPSLLLGVVHIIPSPCTDMWGEVTNTSYNSMPTSLGIMRMLISCLGWGSMADKPRTSRCPSVSVLSSRYYRLYHQSHFLTLFWLIENKCSRQAVCLSFQRSKNVPIFLQIANSKAL